MSRLDLKNINPDLAVYFNAAKENEREELKEKSQLLCEKIDDLSSPSRFSDTQFHASGGLKEISLVYDRFTRRKVAYARLKLEDPSDSQVLDFLKEASITARLQHQNIVPVHKVGVDENNKPYFSMKLIEGLSLQNYLQKGSIQLEKDFSQLELLEIFCKVCDAVSYAHHQGILHLDLKPDNIVVGDHGEVIVCDWGLALEKNQEDEWKLETSEYLQGTPGYLAPERILKESSLRETVDVYALGVILYNVLTCSHPFKGVEAKGLLEKALKGEILKPSTINSDLPQALEAVILKAMALKAEDRYDKVEDLARDVRSWMGGFATQAEGAGFITQARLLIKRNLVESITLLTTFLLITSLTAIFIVQLAEREKRALEARDRAESEKQLRLKLRKRAAGHFYENAVRAEKLHQFDQALYYSEMVVDFVPENKQAHYLLGKLYLAQGKYKEALEAFKRGEGHQQDKYKMIAEALQQGSRSELEILTDCSRLSGGRRVLGAYCFYQPQRVRALGVFKLIQKLTQEKNMEKYLYYEKKQSLKIKSNEFNILAPITVLPLKILDLSETDISYLYPISQMQLKELNVANTKTSDLNPLKKMNLEKLNLRRSNVSDIQQLIGLPLKELDIRGLRLNFEVHLLELKQLKVTEGEISPFLIRKLRERGIEVELHP